MSVRDYLSNLTSGGSGLANTADRHVECRKCGSNLAADADECHDCGGDIAVYELS